MLCLVSCRGWGVYRIQNNAVSTPKLPKKNKKRYKISRKKTKKGKFDIRRIMVYIIRGKGKID